MEIVGKITKNVLLEPWVNEQTGASMSKRNVVIETKECRVGNSGVYAADISYAVMLLGDNADQFPYNVGDWVAASLSFVTKENKYEVTSTELRMNRCVKFDVKPMPL